MTPDLGALRLARFVVVALAVATLALAGGSVAGWVALVALVATYRWLGVQARHQRWQAAMDKAQALLDGDEAEGPVVKAACLAAHELAAPGSPDQLIAELRVTRCRLHEGETSADLERLLRGQLELARRLWGPDDDDYAFAAQSLGIFFWLRARISLERDGVVDFHDPDALYRVGLNVLRYFDGEHEPPEFEDPGDEIEASPPSRMAALAFHWRDLYDAELSLREALRAFRASVGDEHLETGRTLAILAQVVSVNQSPDEAVRLAGDSLAALSRLEGPESRVLAPAYEALGLAYHMIGKPAESRLYLEKSEHLTGVEFEPPEVPRSADPRMPEIRQEPDTAEVRMHVPEEPNPLIH